MTTYGVDGYELVSAEYPKLNFLLEPWLTLPCLAIIWAWRGVGKSWVVTTIGHACGLGGSFLGWKAPAARKVCQIDGELGRRVNAERLEKTDMSSEQSLNGENFRLVTFEDAPGQVIWNLADPAAQEVYTEICKPFDLIIVDNLATCMRPAGRGLQTDVEQWASVQGWAIRQRLAGKSIIFVDHAGKAGHQRGTSTKEDVMDVIISLTRDLDYSPIAGAEFNWRFEKARHFFGEAAMPLRVSLTDDHEGKLRWSWRPLKDHQSERIRSLLRRGMSASAITQELSVTYSRVNEIKREIEHERQDTQSRISSENRGERSDEVF